MRRVPRVLPLAFGLLVGAFPASRARGADSGPELTVPRAEGLVLDGKPTEAAWAGAAVLPAEDVAGVKPTVKLLVGGGRLWILVDVPEDVGFPSGVKGFLVVEGAKEVGDRLAFSYTPQEVRGPRFTARGPKGVGRVFYPLEGAADLSQDDRFTAELSIPLAALDLPTDATGLRLALAVATRIPNRVSAAPPGSAFESDERFARLRAPEGGWGAATAADDPKAAAARVAADAADAARLAAWGQFVGAQRTGGVTKEKARELLVKPLDEAIAARPDLAVLLVFRGNLLRQLGDDEGAKAAYAAALAVVPFLREAQWAVDEAQIVAWTERPDTEPSDYEAAFARAAADAAKNRPGSPAGRAVEGLLRYWRGDFARAQELLDPIVAQYPVDDGIAEVARAAHRYADAWPIELGLRAKDADRELPRVRIVTSKGPVLLELFEDQAPNTVANFLWLAKAGFYDGTGFHRAIPFFVVQGGDPFSKTKDDPRAGAGGPGYAIPSEPAKATKRLPFRGVIALAQSGEGKDTEGSQFFLTTGTAAHLEEGFSVFGRILEGQETVDRLVRGDRVEKVEIVRARDHAYRPTTVAGTPAPDPVPSEMKPKGRR